MDLKISKSQIRKSVDRGGSLFSSLLSLGTKLLPYASKIATKFSQDLLQEHYQVY